MTMTVLTTEKGKPVQEDKAKRVFVVDDERIIATTLGLIFKQAGYDSTSYFDPLQLLAACEVQEPDAVVSDVMMPHMTGVDLALKLATLYPACRVVLISGQAATMDLLQTAKAAGHALDVLPKPIPPATLVEHVRQLLG